MRADHKIPLVREWYNNFKINMTRAKSLDAVQPQCKACSDQQGGEMSAWAKYAEKAWGLID
jgi:hypothetical protein